MTKLVNTGVAESGWPYHQASYYIYLICWKETKSQHDNAMTCTEMIVR